MEDNLHIGNLPLKLCTIVITCPEEPVTQNSLRTPEIICIKDENTPVLNSLITSWFVFYPLGSPVCHSEKPCIQIVFVFLLFSS